MKIEKIGQVAVPVKDLEQAVHFYQDALGLPILFATDSMAFFDCGGVRLLLSLPEKEEFSRSSSVLYFHVADIGAAYDEFTDKGVSFIDKPHVIAKVEGTETWMAFFTDGQGNTHALMNEIETE